MKASRGQPAGSRSADSQILGSSDCPPHPVHPVIPSSLALLKRRCGQHSRRRGIVLGSIAELGSAPSCVGRCDGRIGARGRGSCCFPAYQDVRGDDESADGVSTARVASAGAGRLPAAGDGGGAGAVGGWSAGGAEGDAGAGAVDGVERRAGGHAVSAVPRAEASAAGVAGAAGASGSVAAGVVVLDRGRGGGGGAVLFVGPAGGGGGGERTRTRSRRRCGAISRR